MQNKPSLKRGLLFYISTRFKMDLLFLKVADRMGEKWGVGRLGYKPPAPEPLIVGKFSLGLAKC
jgi:hypothetical protein